MKLTLLIAIVGITQIACAVQNGRKVDGPAKKVAEVNKAGATKKVIHTKATPAKYPKDQVAKTGAAKKKAPIADLSTNTVTSVRKPAKKVVEPATSVKKVKKDIKSETANVSTNSKPISTNDKPIVEQSNGTPKPVEPVTETKPVEPAAETKPVSQSKKPAAPASGAKGKHSTKSIHEPLEQSGDTPISELIASPSEASVAQPFDSKKHEEARKDLLTKQANDCDCDGNSAKYFGFSTSLLIFSLGVLFL